MTRRQCKFWLDDSKDHERVLLQKVNILKEDRAFSRAVRTGLDLFFDLEEGHTDALKRLYPNIMETLRAEIRAEFTADDRLQRIEAQLEALNKNNSRAIASTTREQATSTKPRITVTESDGTGGASDEEIMQNIMNLAKMFG